MSGSRLHRRCYGRSTPSWGRSLPCGDAHAVSCSTRPRDRTRIPSSTRRPAGVPRIAPAGGTRVVEGPISEAVVGQEVALPFNVLIELWRAAFHRHGR